MILRMGKKKHCAAEGCARPRAAQGRGRAAVSHPVPRSSRRAAPRPHAPHSCAPRTLKASGASAVAHCRGRGAEPAAVSLAARSPVPPGPPVRRPTAQRLLPCLLECAHARARRRTPRGASPPRAMAPELPSRPTARLGARTPQSLFAVRYSSSKATSTACTLSLSASTAASALTFASAAGADLKLWATSPMAMEPALAHVTSL